MIWKPPPVGGLVSNLFVIVSLHKLLCVHGLSSVVCGEFGRIRMIGIKVAFLKLGLFHYTSRFWLWVYMQTHMHMHMHCDMCLQTHACTTQARMHAYAHRGLDIISNIPSQQWQQRDNIGDSCIWYHLAHEAGLNDQSLKRATGLLTISVLCVSPTHTHRAKPTFMNDKTITSCGWWLVGGTLGIPPL